MGYTTQFTGILKFKKAPSDDEINKLNSMFGEDSNDHPEWKDFDKYNDLSYIQLEMDSFKTGIRWDGSEKFYNSIEAVNLIIHEMRKTFPDFGLEGSLLAQGEEVGDVWHLYIGEDGFAHYGEININRKQAKCPKCNAKFLLEE